MKIGAVVQARMGSKRLPGKVMLKLGRKTVLEHVISRLKLVADLDAIIVATSLSVQDDIICKWCSTNRVACFRGSENDVLDRYMKAAQHFELGAVVRITADCPLIDPKIIAKLVKIFRLQQPDALGLAGEFPDGLDCQIFSFPALKKAWGKAKLQSDREHVGSYIENTNSKAFEIIRVELFKGLGFHRWTLDEPEDLIFLTKLINGLEKKYEEYSTDDILKYLEEHSWLTKINSHIVRNEGFATARLNDV